MNKDNFFDIYISSKNDNVIVMFHMEKTIAELKKDLKLNNTSLKKKYDENWDDPFNFSNQNEDLPSSSFLNEDSIENISNMVKDINNTKKISNLEEDIFFQFYFKKVRFSPELICKPAIALSEKGKVQQLKNTFQKVTLNIDECSSIEDELEASIKEVINSKVFKNYLNKISLKNGNNAISELDINLIGKDDMEDIHDIFNFYLKKIDVVSESLYLKRKMKQDIISLKDEDNVNEHSVVAKKQQRKVIKF